MAEEMKSIAKSAKFDVYSDMRIPFGTAAWLRQHKFDLIAVRLTRAINSENVLKQQLEIAQAALDKQQAEIKALVAKANEKAE